MGQPVLEVKHLSVSFSQYGRGLSRRVIFGVRDLSLSIHDGEIVAVVGSSGSGKSLLAHAIMGILPYNAAMEGEIFYFGEPLTKKRVAALRGKELVLVPQSVSYLDPLMKVGAQVLKGDRSAGGLSKRRKLFDFYGLDPGTEEKYPFQLSGGMARRVLNVTAAMEQPKLVIADEPTPGLHLEAAKKVMEDFRRMAGEGAGVLLITHDLELALLTADRVAVLYGGKAVEEAAAADFSDPLKLSHEYTRELVRSMPKNWGSSV